MRLFLKFFIPPYLSVDFDNLLIPFDQARECLFEKTELTYLGMESGDRNKIDTCLELGQEAAHVSDVYEKVQEAISQPPVKDYVPFTWVSLVQVKKEHYKALANFYVAIALIDNR